MAIFNVQRPDVAAASRLSTIDKALQVQET